MVNNFFKIANPKFFNPLTGKNKEVNYDLLCYLNHALEKETTLERSEMVNLILEFVKANPLGESFDDENQSKRADLRSFPNDKLRYFEECGWISSEPTNNFKQVYQMEPIAIEVLRSMIDLTERDEKPLESAGFVYSIYSALKNFSLHEATYIVERLSDDSKSLQVNLRTVNSKIKKYLNDLMANDHQSPKKILKELLLNYQNNVVAKSFNNLRTTDNPSKYKDFIINTIYDLKNNHMEELVDDYVLRKFNGRHNEENELAARVFFNSTFNEIIDQFNNIDKVISVLEMQNSRYVTSARKRVNFLMNDKANIEGQIDNILRIIEHNNVDDEFEFTFDIDDRGKIDDTSLYVYTKNRNNEPANLANTDVPYDAEAERKYVERIKWQKKFSITSVNNFIMSKLGDANELLASKIEIQDFDEFVILFLAQIFSESDIVEYYIDATDGDISYENRRISNFIIKRRKTK